MTNVIPENIRPYAKTVVAFIIGVVGLLVSLFVIDGEDGIRISQAISALATLLGVYEIPNTLEVAERVRTDDIDEVRGPGTHYRR